ncbi:LysM peptidoglycan-binding domain-containing protein [Bacillus wiedmannii]|uniref:LysM peptidoglycan-binding domain-containing protein n=1 Tax=Bacillus wiedmannii TaxID=1890302 RepID=UPI00197AC94C|nr:LysM peptidoglycan-binding domain-containing protein [Bacillus wiedmannii]
MAATDTQAYTVQPGDTMSEIAATSGMELGHLITLNPEIQNPHMIFPGDFIYTAESAESAETPAKTQAPQPEPQPEVAKPAAKPVDSLPQKAEPVKESENVGGWKPFEFTYYGMDCVGCSGVTAAGYDVRGGQTTIDGMKVIAVNPKIIPLHSIVEIKINGNTFRAIAADTGGAMRQRTDLVDILVGSEAESAGYGRDNGQLRIIRHGKG